jgi:hypothetical protein
MEAFVINEYESEGSKSARHKVEQILNAAFGDKAVRVFSSQNVGQTMRVIVEAFASEMDSKKAEELAFNMADWGGNAAFVVALHLFPERFTADEIREATRSLAFHVPYHANNVADILGVSERAIPLKKRRRNEM